MEDPVPGYDFLIIEPPLLPLLTDSPVLLTLLDIIVELLAGLSELDPGHGHGERCEGEVRRGEESSAS